VTHPCPACQAPQVSTSTLRPETLCSDCRERLYEDLASALDPTYDRTKMNDWERLERACKGMAFPLPTGGHPWKRGDASH
jgi:hypothetical protein